MAELIKKLHIKKGEVTETAKIYSTAAEVGDNKISLNVDGITCYVPLGDATDSMATRLRVTKNDVVYAAKNQAIIPYGYAIFTSSGTFTVPAGVTKVRVTVCGGGGAGLFTAGQLAFLRNGTASAIGGSGGASSALGIVARGGSGGVSSVTRSGQNSSYKYSYQVATGTGGSGFVMLNNVRYGSGGGEYTYTTNSAEGGQYAQGGCGYVIQQIVNVTSTNIYPVTVGIGGTGYSLDSASKFRTVHVYSGSSGAVQIEWGKGI